MIVLVDDARGVEIPVVLKRWTSSGRVQVGGVFATEPGHSAGMFFPVNVFSLRHAQGRPALVEALRRLPHG